MKTGSKIWIVIGVLLAVVLIVAGVVWTLRKSKQQQAPPPIPPQNTDFQRTIDSDTQRAKPAGDINQFKQP